MFRRLIAAAIALMVATTPPIHAQGARASGRVDFEAPESQGINFFKIIFPGGCYVYEWGGNGEYPDDEEDEFFWSGTCLSGQAVTGQGKMRRQASPTGWTEWTAAYAKGFRDGPLKWHAYIGFNPADSRNQYGTEQYVSGCETTGDDVVYCNEEAAKLRTRLVGPLGKRATAVAPESASTPVTAGASGVVRGPQPTQMGPSGNGCVKLDRVERDTIKNDNGTWFDNTNFTVISKCPVEQIFYVNFLRPDEGVQLPLGLPVAFPPALPPYSDSRSLGGLRPQPGRVSAPFAGTHQNPYVGMFVPAPPSHTPTPQLSVHTIRQGEIYQLRFITNDYPNFRPIAYVVASCDRYKDHLERYLFLNISKGYTDCIPIRQIKVIK